MAECECDAVAPTSAPERRAVSIALALNASMFVVGTAAGVAADSTALIADALDMLADASAYGLALFAIGRTATFKRRSARLSAVLLALLGLGIVVESVRRFLDGSAPDGGVMIAVAALSLVVNATVLRLLAPLREGGIHLRASWIFTRADVIANVGVIVAAGLVLVTGHRYPDLVIGAAIGTYVIREALELRSEARRPALNGGGCA
jgi:cation diffusion facilitator family transporter